MLAGGAKRSHLQLRQPSTSLFNAVSLPLAVPRLPPPWHLAQRNMILMPLARLCLITLPPSGHLGLSMRWSCLKASKWYVCKKTPPKRCDCSSTVAHAPCSPHLQFYDFPGQPTAYRSATAVSPEPKYSTAGTQNYRETGKYSQQAGSQGSGSGSDSPTGPSPRGASSNHQPSLSQSPPPLQQPPHHFGIPAGNQYLYGYHPYPYSFPPAPASFSQVKLSSFSLHNSLLTCRFQLPVPICPKTPRVHQDSTLRFGQQRLRFPSRFLFAWRSRYFNISDSADIPPLPLPQFIDMMIASHTALSS